MVSEQEVTEMVELAKLLRVKVEEWLAKNHPDM
jgi:hypothetical protein